MAKRGKFVVVKTDNTTSVHADSDSGNYDTLCGIDANDPAIGHNGTLPEPENAQISCSACIRIIRFCWRYKRADIAADRANEGR